MAQQGPQSAGTTGPADARGRTGLSGGLLATIIGGGLLLLFVVQNRNDVRFDFLFWGFTWPLWLLTLVSAALGALVWIGLGILRRHRRRVARREARRDG